MPMTKPATTIETIATSCIAGRLRLLNRVITNLYDDALRPLGVKLSQGNILAVTAKLGVARPAQVCDILQLDTSTPAAPWSAWWRTAGSKSCPMTMGGPTRSASRTRAGG